jgi:hypothetical protein
MSHRGDGFARGWDGLADRVLLAAILAVVYPLHSRGAFLR